jgi:phosphonate metabolism protein PhnN/1,5-bisphosphokinase (PRPP-forming)
LDGRRGLLLAVVGASGVGKDSLIAGAATRLARDPRFVFARRVVTRAADSGGEQHVPMEPARFDALRDGGAFALAWNAHGISYGIPASLRAVIAEGRVVVANLSRTKLVEAAQALGPTIAIEVTAPPDLLHARLIARGREDAAAIEKRMARQVALPAAVRRIEFVNDAPLQHAVANFTALLGRVVAAECEASDQHQLGTGRLFEAEGEVE